MHSKYVRRVDQFDAISLDSELFMLLNAQYRKALMYLPSSMVAKISPEMDMLFRLFFKYLPLKYLGASFGQNIFQLKYYNCSTLSPLVEKEICWLVALSVVMPWFWDRILKRILVKYYQKDNTHFGSDLPCNYEQKITTLWKFFSLLNFCVFLQQSKFPSLVERILYIRPLYTASQDLKVLQYDGASKELLWHGLYELLGFTLPLINVYRLKNYYKRIWCSWSGKDQLMQIKKNKNFCLICEEIPNFPHTIGCAHVFCYYCIASMVLADPNFSCLDCNYSANGLNSIKPLPINKPESWAKS